MDWTVYLIFYSYFAINLSFYLPYLIFKKTSFLKYNKFYDNVCNATDIQINEN